MWCEVEHNLLQGAHERRRLSPNWHQGKAHVYWNERDFGPVSLQDEKSRQYTLQLKKQDSAEG